MTYSANYIRQTIILGLDLIKYFFSMTQFFGYAVQSLTLQSPFATESNILYLDMATMF